MLACTEAAVNALAQWAHDHPEADLDQREAQVLEQGRRVLAGLLTLLATAAAPRAPGRCPGCGERAAGLQERQRARAVLSRCGLLRWRQALVTCGACGTTWRPLERALGLAPRQRLTAGARAWLVELGAQVPFREAAGLLERLTGLGVGAETVRRHAEAAGRALEAALQAAIARVERTREPAAAVEAAPGRLLVETDGVLLRFRDGWHEVKLALVAGWQAGRLVGVSDVAAREPAEAFGGRLLAEAARRGALEVVAWQGRLWGPGLAVLRAVTVLGDGAAWIWQLAAEHFGERTEVVDWWHASQHLWAVATALHGEGTAAARAWVQPHLTALWEQGAAPVGQALRALHPPDPAAAEVVRVERGYFATNAARMDYPALRARGLPVGSGPIESTCKHLVQQRMKRAGMRWSTPGGQALLTLRAHLASGRPLPRAA
jgi:hypothetical protein